MVSIDTTTARAQLTAAMDEWRPRAEPSYAETEADIVRQLRYARNGHTAVAALKDVDQIAFSSDEITLGQWLDTRAAVRAAIAAMTGGTDDVQ